MGVRKDAVTVKCPASSANLGTGFDSIGVAVDIWVVLTVKRSESFAFWYNGSQNHEFSLGRGNPLIEAFTAGLVASGVDEDATKFEFICVSDIPMGSGLGSSAAARVAGAAASFILCGRDISNPVTLHQLADLACDLEGHPDNVLPAVYGSMQIGSRKDPSEKGDPDVKWIMQGVPFPTHELGCVVYVPDEPFSTPTARMLVPNTFSRHDTVHNISRACILVAALLTGNWDNLRFGVMDVLHQPYREKNCPAFVSLKSFQNTEGLADPAISPVALFLSGSGPSVMMWVMKGAEERITAAAKAACPELNGRFLFVTVANQGVHEVDS